MLLSPCAELKTLSTLLRDKYDVRNKILARGYPDPSLLQAEIEIIRVQKLVTRHRRRCSQCKQNETSAIGGRWPIETTCKRSIFYANSDTLMGQRTIQERMSRVTVR